LLGEISRLHEEAKDRLRVQIGSNSHRFAIPDSPGLDHQALYIAIDHRLKRVVELGDRAPALETVTASEPEEGLVQINYGTLTCATLPTYLAQEAIEFITSLMAQIEELPECAEIQRLLSAVSNVQRNLSEEFATIVLKRVVPGRCKYCPL